MLFESLTFDIVPDKGIDVHMVLNKINRDGFRLYRLIDFLSFVSEAGLPLSDIRIVQDVCMTLTWALPLSLRDFIIETFKDMPGVTIKEKV